MAAENVLATQVTLGLLGSGLLNLLKKSSVVTAVNDRSGSINHLILLATSAIGALGVHTVWDASQHSLVISGLDLATILASFWIWGKQWAIQYLVHRGAFGTVSTPAAVPVSAPTASAGIGNAKPLARMRLAFIVLLCTLLPICTLLFGCAAGQYTAAKANQTVTTVIADAGTVAIQAEQDYQSGRIPQTSSARTAINDLGDAYNQAKGVYSALLFAEAGYNSSTLAQVTLCQPASTQGGVVPDPAKCQGATQTASAAKAAVDAAQLKLSASLDALTAKTTAVKALSPR